MNSYEIPYESFIGGWFISENICDKVISYFESKSDNHFKGNVGGKEYDNVLYLDLDVIPKVPSLKMTPSFTATIKIDDNFISRFVNRNRCSYRKL